MKDLFLCHTGADKDWVRMLAERLERERIDNRQIEVFFDEWDIEPGENIIDKIDKGLRESRYIALILSPRMLAAEWPQAEWQSQIMDDPSGKRVKILPLLRHKTDPETGEGIEIPFVLRTLLRLDFTVGKRFESEFKRLVRKLSDLPPRRGSSRSGGLGSRLGYVPLGQEAPDPIEESLPSNLFPVTSIPESLYSDDTSAQKYPDVWKRLSGTRVPPFTLHAGRLVSFIPPHKDNPFDSLLAKTEPRSEKLRDWLSDRDLRSKAIGLLNSALRAHCYHLGIFTAKKDRSLFYCPVFKDGASRVFVWDSRSRSRGLAKMKKRADGSLFGVHMSARMKFIWLGAHLHLLVEPGWMFTTDGIVPLEGKEVGIFSTKWGGKERNATVLRNILMWGLLLSEGGREAKLHLGPDSFALFAVLQGVPSHTKLSQGLAGDQIRLDKILGGEGAGQRIIDPTSEEADTTELDEIAERALVGTVKPSRTDRESKASAARTDDDDADEEGVLELPF